MRIEEFRRQLDEAINGVGLTDADEVVLDTEDGNYGIASLQTEDGRLIISAGDPEDE